MPKPSKEPRKPSDVIRTARLAAGLTQAQLARAIGAHTKTVGKIDRGERPVSASLAIGISRVLGIDLARLLPDAGIPLGPRGKTVRLVCGASKAWSPATSTDRSECASVLDLKSCRAPFSGLILLELIQSAREQGVTLIFDASAKPRS